MKCVVLHVLVTLSVILQVQAAAAVLIADKADIVTAAARGDFDLVLLHLIADPASANQRNHQYTTPFLHSIRARMHL
jgi:hypothetical protein